MKTILAATALLLVSTGAYAQSSPQQFTEKAASGGLFEIQSSQDILDAGVSDAEVREFAEQMVADHTKAAADLKAAAEKAGTEVPTAPARKEATKLDYLAKASENDKVMVYLTQQRTSHNDAVVLHRGYAAAGTDANLKAYAETVLPVLEEHAKHVDMLHAEKAKSM